MFWHNFKYSLKTLLRNKGLLFWTFIFPILLGLFFHMAFSDIEKKEKLDIINIAVIDNEEFKKDEIFKAALKSLSEENDKQLFNITYTSLKNAKKLLSSKDITGYLLFNSSDVSIYVNSNGVDETIIRYVVDEISSNKEIISNLSSKEIEKEINDGNYNINYEKIYQDIITLINKDTVKLNNISNKNLSYTMIEYYTLIAMACLYGGMLSMFITNYKLANMNSVGKRTSISPIRKDSMLLGTFLASYVVQLIGVAILFIFTILVLKVNYGNNLPLIILLACFGSFAGLSLGIAIATLFKVNENAKTGILLAITMTGCFLSGMMGITMKYVIDKNIPIINKINPANMITDGFYSLYYHDTLNRYYFNILSLFIFSCIMLLISYKGLRRQKYDSI